MWLSCCLLLLLLAFLPSPLLLHQGSEVKSFKLRVSLGPGSGLALGGPGGLCGSPAWLTAGLPGLFQFLLASPLLVVMYYVQEETQQLLLLPIHLLRQEDLGTPGVPGSTISPSTPGLGCVVIETGGE